MKMIMINNFQIFVINKKLKLKINLKIMINICNFYKNKKSKNEIHRKNSNMISQRKILDFQFQIEMVSKKEMKSFQI